MPVCGRGWAEQGPRSLASAEPVQHPCSFSTSPILAPLVQRRGLRDSAEGKVLGDRQVRAPAQQCVHLQQGPQASPKPATLTAHCSHFSRRPSETLATLQFLPSLVRFTLPLKKNFIKMIPGSNFLNFHTPHPTLLDTYTALLESLVSGWVFSRAPSSPSEWNLRGTTTSQPYSFPLPSKFKLPAQC